MEYQDENRPTLSKEAGLGLQSLGDETHHSNGVEHTCEERESGMDRTGSDEGSHEGGANVSAV